MIYNYCPICGNKLIERSSWDEGTVPYCENDDMFFFNTPKPCVVVSGYVTNGETVEETVYREVKEETGITIGDIKYLGSQCIEDKDLLMLTFVSKYEDGEINKSSEVEWVGWHDLDIALCEMVEDKIGKNVVKHILDELKIESKACTYNWQSN